MKKVTEKELLPGGITQAQLDEWKRANPEGVYPVEVTLSAEEKNKDGKVTKEKEVATIYLRDPFNKPEIITEAMGKDSKHEMQEYILGALFLGGDKEKVFANRKAKFWVSVKAYQLIEVNEVVLKKA